MKGTSIYDITLYACNRVATYVTMNDCMITPRQPQAQRGRSHHHRWCQQHRTFPRALPRPPLGVVGSRASLRMQRWQLELPSPVVSSSTTQSSISYSYSSVRFSHLAFMSFWALLLAKAFSALWVLTALTSWAPLMWLSLREAAVPRRATRAKNFICSFCFLFFVFPC